MEGEILIDIYDSLLSCFFLMNFSRYWFLLGVMESFGFSLQEQKSKDSPFLPLLLSQIQESSLHDLSLVCSSCFGLVSSGRALHVSIVKTTRRSRVLDKSFTKKPESQSRLIRFDEKYFLEDIFMAIL